MRSLGAVVAVIKCSPSGDHWRSVVSEATVEAMNFLFTMSQISTLPCRLPKPANINSAQKLRIYNYSFIKNKKLK